ncbi:MAG TPA: protein TolR [Myxococcota bacterium]|nr:protein TolR [Myxococcota bacterium]HRY93181.1 protein TolR [Myxococcota bacterium]
MSMSTGSGDATLSEINVTPLVDVMLVLLIIFMVTAPLMQQGVEVDLPQTDAAPIDSKEQDRLVLTIQKDRKIFVGETEVAREELEAKLTANEKLKRDKELYLKADRELPYGVVVDIMALLKRAGVDQVGMLTEPPPPAT